MLVKNYNFPKITISYLYKCNLFFLRAGCRLRAHKLLQEYAIARAIDRSRCRFRMQDSIDLTVNFTRHRWILRRYLWYDIRTGWIVDRVMCSTSYNDLNWDMCPGDDGGTRERLSVWLTIRESDPCRGGKQLLVGGGEVPGKEKKKRLPPGTQLMLTWKPMPACIPAWAFFCAMPSARTHSQSHGSIRYTTVLGTIYDSKTLITWLMYLIWCILENSFWQNDIFIQNRIVSRITLEDLSKKIHDLHIFFKIIFFFVNTSRSLSIQGLLCLKALRKRQNIYMDKKLLSCQRDFLS